MPRPHRSQILNHLGLVAGMFGELGMGDVMDQATQQHPDTRMVTVERWLQLLAPPYKALYSYK